MAITIFDPLVFDYMQDGKYTMTSIILEMAAKELVTTFRYDKGYWIDIGSPDKLSEARQLL
jgi:NDP-sugar pyrophosphorylase family protein